MEGSDIEHIVIKQELMDRMNDNDATIVHIDEVTIENDHDYGRGGWDVCSVGFWFNGYVFRHYGGGKGGRWSFEEVRRRGEEVLVALGDGYVSAVDRGKLREVFQSAQEIRVLEYDFEETRTGKYFRTYLKSNLVYPYDKNNKSFLSSTAKSSNANGETCSERTERVSPKTTSARPVSATSTKCTT